MSSEDAKRLPDSLPDCNTGAKVTRFAGGRTEFLDTQPRIWPVLPLQVQTSRPLDYLDLMKVGDLWRAGFKPPKRRSILVPIFPHGPSPFPD